MTLTTTIAVHEPMPVRELYQYGRELIGTPAHVVAEDEPGRLGNPPGLGLDAWLWVTYIGDGPMIDAPYPNEQDEDPDDRIARESDPTSNGWASLALQVDTGYGAGRQVPGLLDGVKTSRYLTNVPNALMWEMQRWGIEPQCASGEDSE